MTIFITDVSLSQYRTGEVCGEWTWMKKNVTAVKLKVRSKRL